MGGAANGTISAVNGTVAALDGRPGLDRVTVVIPAKDEARNVAWVLRRLPPWVDEVILVDGRSIDDTVAVARAIRPDVVVAAERGPGKGAALRTGLELARGDVIVTIDADGSMDPRELDRYVERARDVDLVKGSRFARDGGTEDISFVRRVGNAMLLLLVNVLYGANLTDLCYGFCAFRRSFLDQLDLHATGFEIETEMIVHALRSGLRIAEVPSLELPRRNGRSNLHAITDGRRVLRTLISERPGAQSSAASVRTAS